jgi:hypothetical protein
MTPIKCLPGGRPCLFVGVTVLVGALALPARTSWPGDDLPDGQGSSEERVRQANLEQKVQATARRIRRKQRVSQEVLAGRLTLLEAAALFRALDHAPPEFKWDHFRASTPADSDDERHCHEVIHWVSNTVRHPCEAEALRQDLDTQRSEYRRLGPLRLRQINELPPWLDD